MNSISEAIAVAVQHHQAGRLVEAEAIYRQILAVDPNHIDALHLMGVIAHQIDQREEAADYIRRAIALNANEASFHNSLGNTLKAHRRWDEAVTAYRRAIQLKPDYAEAHNHLGNTLRALGKFDEAVAAHQRAIVLKPTYADAHNNLGNALIDQRKFDEAIAAYRRTLELKPSNVEARSNLGIALKDLGQLDEAIAEFKRALEFNPRFAIAHNNLGNALRDQGRLDEAAACFTRALEINPKYAEAYNGRAIVLQGQGKLDEAVAAYGRALELRPDYADALNNLGNALTAQGKLDDAVDCFQRALNIRPDFAEAFINLGATLQVHGKWDEAIAVGQRALELIPDVAAAHVNLAHALLTLGDWQRGWREYEWRWKTKEVEAPTFARPQWDGEPLAGKTIVLHSEQGLGDTIQFIRYAAVLKKQGATVIVKCHDPLRKLLADCEGVDQWLSASEPLPPFDFHCPLLSLPKNLRTSIDTIPAEIPYLRARPKLLEKWGERMRREAGLKVGINWQGNPKLRFDRFRSIPLRHFGRLARVPGVRLFSLQKGAGSEQLAAINGEFEVVDLAKELDHDFGPFMDTAAVMKHLDLIITSDTATAHLAGALGVPVWVALQYAPDWRWLLHRSDSPWYPTMHLFRQKESQNWETVFEEMRLVLCQHPESEAAG